MADVEQSILDSVKKNVGLGADYDVFDLSIKTHINTVFSTLAQIGIGPPLGFMIEDAEATWNSFLAAQPLLNAVKSYMYLKVRLLFDPPSSSFVLTSMEKQITELEWRLLVAKEELDGYNPPVIVVLPDPASIDGGGADLP